MHGFPVPGVAIAHESRVGLPWVLSLHMNRASFPTALHNTHFFCTHERSRLTICTVLSTSLIQIDGSCSSLGVAARLHGNLCHNWLKTHLPSFTGLFLFCFSSQPLSQDDGTFHHVYFPTQFDMGNPCVICQHTSRQVDPPKASC